MCMQRLKVQRVAHYAIKVQGTPVAFLRSLRLPKLWFTPTQLQRAIERVFERQYPSLPAHAPEAVEVEEREAVLIENKPQQISLSSLARTGMRVKRS